MWEIPIYLFIVPVLTIAVSLISAIKFEKYFIAPLFSFIVLNIPIIIMPTIGWEAIFGWAAFYSAISLIISFIVWNFKKRLLL